jgi:hypothetical protein
MNTPVDRLSVTPTLSRQTPRNEFGQVLKNTLTQVASAGSTVGGALVGALPGGAIVSAAVSSVTALANQGTRPGATAQAASGITTVSPGGVQTVGGGTTLDVGSSNTGGFNDMLHTMRQEADKSLLQQMQMQQESRQYNAVSNVLKVRHDSAKAAINNIR